MHYFAKVCHFGSINDFWRRICKVKIENYKIYNEKGSINKEIGRDDCRRYSKS